MLKSWCTTQPTVALSSAEAELVAAVRGAAEGLFVHALARDFGCDCRLEFHLDSSAAIGIRRRTGVGKIRHLDTRLLWIQERVQSCEIKIVKVAGVVNPADLLTKHLVVEVASTRLSRLNCWPREGRAALAPHL